MADIKRISVQQAYAKTKANQALLVCAYEDEAKCRMLNLDGSISFTSLQSRAASLPKTQEIIFYGAGPGEASAVGQAAKYQAQGFTNVKVLEGGVGAWKTAGYSMIGKAELLREWKKEQGQQSPFLFPSPRDSNKPIGSVKKAWRTTLKRAGVSYFPIYNLRHVFCTRLSWVAPDAVVQRAMRHSSPETKRVYQLGLVHQVREHMERANDKAYQGREALHLRDSASREACAEKMKACK